MKEEEDEGRFQQGRAMWLPGMPDGALAAGWPSPGAAQAPGGGERAHRRALQL